MISFKEFVTNEKIINEVCKIRIKELINYQQENLFTDNKYNSSKRIFSLVPPRNSWIKSSKKTRVRLKTNSDLNFINLKRTILRDFNLNNDWNKKLNRLIQNIGKNISAKKPIKKPYLIRIPKPNGDTREISLYSLEDRILSTLTYQYLVYYYDNNFSPNSWAFRGLEFKRNKKNISKERIIRDITDDIENVLSSCSEEATVWDLDIKAFFDNIDKKAIKDSIDKLSDLDNDVRTIINSYIDSYPKEKGIPQGNAISCFIANLVLDDIDRLIENHTKGSYSSYYRYCDDILIVNPINLSIDNLSSQFKVLGLELHNPIIIDNNKDFKNKETYKQKSKIITLNKSNHIWISFLGYSFKSEGNIRIKKNSIEKELEKQKEAVSKLIRNFYSDSKVLDKKDLYKKYYILTNAFMKRWTNRISSRNSNNKFYSWATSFNLLNDNTNSTFNNVKMLDRAFRRQIFRLKKLGICNRKINYNNSYYGAFKVINKDTNI